MANETTDHPFTAVRSYNGPPDYIPRKNSGRSLCAPLKRSACRCTIPLPNPPKRPDPWIYDPHAGQEAQFAAWPAAPVTPTPLTFWIPDAAWQLAAPGWAAPIAFFLPACGINLYSDLSPTARNGLPSAPASVVKVTVGNKNAVTSINTRVALSMSYFGIGRKRIPVAEQLVTIPPAQAVDVTFPLPPSFLNETVTTADGVTVTNPQVWLGAYVHVSHPYDENPANDDAISMWMGIDTTGGGGPGSVVSPAIPVINEFSSETETIILTVIPSPGVSVSSPPGPLTLNPGQLNVSGCNLTVPPSMDNGTFLAPLATVVGVTATGKFAGGMTIVGSVND